jgi:hypothetical protein
MNQNKHFMLVLLLLLFIVSCSKMLLIPITLIICGFFVIKKKYNIALIVLSVLFVISLIFNNNVELFDNKNIEPFYNPSTSSTEPSTESTESTPSSTESTTSSTAISTSSTESTAISTSSSPSNKAKKPHVLYAKDYNKLVFVLTSLIDKKYMKQNKVIIDEIIDNYRINSIFDLSRTVLNKEKNPYYNNFLEKITCRTNGKVDYIQCNNPNYKRLYAFCELIYVFTFNLDNVIELINKYKIMSVCELGANRLVLKSDKSNTSYGYETLGLEYYLNEKSFSRKYYDILELLELDTILNTDESEAGITLEERLYNYHNSNKTAVKDLNSIMVLFDFYEIFDKYILNMEDDEYNWNLGILKGVDLNLSCWDSVYYFTEYDVKERIIKSINKLTSVDDEFLNRGYNPINPYDPKNNSDIDSKRTRNMLSGSISDDGYVEEDDSFKDNLNSFKKRYKTIYDKSENEKERVRDKLDRKINLKYIRDNFNSKMIDITNDLINLSQKRCNLDCNDSKNPMFAKVIYYSRETLKLLTKDERMMYVGILLIILSIIFYFISASR